VGNLTALEQWRRDEELARLRRQIAKTRENIAEAHRLRGEMLDRARHWPGGREVWGGEHRKYKRWHNEQKRRLVLLKAALKELRAA